MGMAAEIESIAPFFGFGRELGGMHQRDAEFVALRPQLVQAGERRIAVEAVDVVEPGDGERRRAAHHARAFVDQAAHATLLQRRDQRRGVVIAEHGDGAVRRAHGADQPGERTRHGVVSAAIGEEVVAGQRHQVDRDAVDRGKQPVGQRRMPVEMKIAEVQDAITVESRGQAGQRQLQLDQADVEGIRFGEPAEADGAYTSLEGPLERRFHGIEAAALGAVGREAAIAVPLHPLPPHAPQGSRRCLAIGQVDAGLDGSQ